MDQDTGTAGEDAGRRVCYGLVAVDLLTILFCSLANLAGVAVACAVTGVAALLLALAFWFAPARGGGGTAHRMCACGLAPGVSTASLPTFKYEPAAADAAGGGVGEGSSVLCAVCLEGVEAGEMVRQLPACSHLFHVDCIDVWLRSRRTCPLCRCVLGPAARKPSGSASITAAAMAAAAMGSGGVVVPPV